MIKNITIISDAGSKSVSRSAFFNKKGIPFFKRLILNIIESNINCKIPINIIGHIFINDILGNKTIQIMLIGKVAKAREIKLSANEIIDILMKPR